MLAAAIMLPSKAVMIHKFQLNATVYLFEEEDENGQKQVQLAQKPTSYFFSAHPAIGKYA